MILELFLVAAALLLYAFLKDRKPSNMPPGPAEIPLIGNAPIENITQVEAFRKQYGNIFTTRLGSVRQVMVSDYNIAKEVLGRVECSDRHNVFRVGRVDPTCDGGLIGSNGLFWVHDRRFVLRHLRDLGMGKTYLEGAIQDEAQSLVDHLKSFNGEPTLYPVGLRTAVLNVVWQLVAGRRYDLTSKEVTAIFDAMEKFRKGMSMLRFVEEFFPTLKLIPQFIKNPLFKVDVMKNFRKEMTTIIDNSIRDHEKNLDENNPRDLIDDYLIELKKNRDNPESLFSRNSLYQIIADLFGAGSDTVTNMLHWIIFYMARYPEITRRCQEDIDQEVGRGQLVSILDKHRLPYVEAFTNEAFRHASLVFIGFQRLVTKDCTVGEYHVPKGATVEVNAYHIHYDPDFWEDPETFKPERFLDSNGKFQAKQGRIFAFGTGRRLCPGESLARMMFFLFTSAILQNFTIEKPPGSKFDESVNEALGIRYVNDQSFIYKYRNV